MWLLKFNTTKCMYSGTQLQTPKYQKAGQKLLKNGPKGITGNYYDFKGSTVYCHCQLYVVLQHWQYNNKNILFPSLPSTSLRFSTMIQRKFTCLMSLEN